MDRVAMIRCEKCDGRGSVPDDRAFGARMRAKREAQSISLREVARRGKLDPSYLSDAECGRRRWNERLVTLYRRVLKLEELPYAAAADGR